MVQSKSMEIIVGLFVLLGLAALLMLSMKVSNLSALTDTGGYEVKANFENIGGLKTRAPVKMAGVVIGRVSRIAIDLDNYDAVVVMKINDSYRNIPTDSDASIHTAGLLGEQYISLKAGGSETFLADGGQIRITSSAIVLEDVIGQFMYSQAAGDDQPF